MKLKVVGFTYYRRTRGLLALLACAIMVLVVTLLSIAVTAILGVTFAVVALVRRAVRPARGEFTGSRREPWPHKTIDATVVSATSVLND